MRGEVEWTGSVLLAAVVWVICDAAGLNDWISAGVAFVVAYTVRMLAMWRGWEEPMPKQPESVNLHDNNRPLLGPNPKGTSEQELRDLGLPPKDGPDKDEA